MISSEQKDLADYVKQVHLSLRCKSREIGAEKAWEQHLKNESVLQKYAISMKKLAEIWSVNNRAESDKCLCRIEWTVNYIIDYFSQDGLKNELEKEFKKIKIFHEKGLIANYDNSYSYIGVKPPFKFLDVGSCYNPFKKFDFLEVYPIDLFPADLEVKKCNFLEISVVQTGGNWFHDDLKILPANFFDVVVFSLFLEYLPSPNQRYWSCVNAYKCLKTNGLLFIITPDSKHATANSTIMKSWKIAAAQIGFVRTKLEKLKYLHCMAFRKSVARNYAMCLYNIKVNEYNFEEMFVIPQDSVAYKSGEKPIKKSEEYEEELKQLFEELPCL